MLIVVSPAKSLDFDSKLPTKKHSEPRMLDDAEALVDVMSDKSPAEISKMMSVSESLGELNHERFQDWEAPFSPDNARPALLAFNGDVYLGMDAANTNVNGGAIALGQPTGCSGSRILVTLMHEMKRRAPDMPKDKPFYGLATLCVGVGMGSATLVEWIGDR